MELTPKERAWATLKSSLNKFSEDFMDSRNQPKISKRDCFDSAHNDGEDTHYSLDCFANARNDEDVE
ncbi:MAG: antitoxin [Peptococcales bacterium]